MKGGFALGLTNRCGWTDISKSKVTFATENHWLKSAHYIRKIKPT